MRKISLYLAVIVAALSLSFAVVPAYASCPSGNVVTGNPADGAECASSSSQSSKSLPAVIGDIVNIALFIIGAISVVMLIYGGITYSTSAGDSTKITKAKHTIMYAIVGLVVAILAYAIVGFVIDNIKSN
jgi:lysylphosphatidylglycerol synthetase-like protein (DUF2156 family)